MNNPVQATLTTFANICSEKQELPCFDYSGLTKFFREVEKDYPQPFKESIMSEDNIYEGLSPFIVSRVIKSVAQTITLTFFQAQHYWFMKSTSQNTFQKSKKLHKDSTTN